MAEATCPVCGARLEIRSDIEIVQAGPPVAEWGLEELELIGQRAYNRLHEAGIATIGDLTERTAADLLRLPGFGVLSLQEVEDGLGHLGLALRS